jgi:3-hydroxyacyl-CoA dehydrogenase
MDLQYKYYSALEELHIKRNQISNHNKERDDILKQNMEYYNDKLKEKESIIEDNEKIMASYKKSKARYSKTNKNLKVRLKMALDEVDRLHERVVEITKIKNQILEEFQQASDNFFKHTKDNMPAAIRLDVKEFKRLRNKLKEDNAED